jgi:hypothetical protein
MTIEELYSLSGIHIFRELQAVNTILLQLFFLANVICVCPLSLSRTY